MDRIAVKALGALAQEHRLAAFRLLVQSGCEGIPAGILSERLGLPASSMSFHLSHLANSGLVTQRREGRSIIYAADYQAMNGLIGYLTEHCCQGSASSGPAPNMSPARTEKDQ